MPCNSCGRPSGDDYEARKQITKLESMLCALIKISGLDAALAKADWAEAGVDGKELQDWWNAHQQKDAARQTAERATAAANLAREEALSKLSPEERTLLGLSPLGWRPFK